MANCQGHKANGDPCSRTVKDGDYCHQHKDQEPAYASRDELLTQSKCFNCGAQMLRTRYMILCSADCRVEPNNGGAIAASQEETMPEERKTKKVHVTGHRPDKIKDQGVVLAAMILILQVIILANPDYDIVVVTGGADGADRLWARAARHLGLRLNIVVPRGYFDYYHKNEEWVKNMMAYAKESGGGTYYTQDFLTDYEKELKKNAKHYNFVRNSQLIRLSDMSVVVSQKAPAKLANDKFGGTADCVRQMRDIYDTETVTWINALDGSIVWDTKLTEEVMK